LLAFWANALTPMLRMMSEIVTSMPKRDRTGASHTRCRADRPEHRRPITTILFDVRRSASFRYSLPKFGNRGRVSVSIET
jgi:hypothetical protein